MEILESHRKLLGDEVCNFCLYLCENLDQSSLFAFWPAAGIKDKEKKQMCEQLICLNENYPGGLKAYVQNSKLLLQKSKDGDNPFTGFVPQIPVGKELSLTNDKLSEFLDMEALGMEDIGNCCFVIVAGGMGERLGYSGIKLELPTDLMTNYSFLELYIKNILAIQDVVGEKCKIPLAIMTSDDTHAKTIELLTANHNFGLEQDQISIIKQEKVPALLDISAHFAVDEANFEIITKPHGHGDVHSLLYTSGLAKKWNDLGKKYVLFIQDTNILVFRGIIASLGVSKKLNLAMNSLTVPRNDGEAVGSICKLVNQETGEELTINVEYNQLDDLLKASKVSLPKSSTDPKLSPFPGNINVLILQIPVYYKALEISHGGVPEFVNPKYADATKIRFKTPTRLECMMQDFPRLLLSPAVIKAVGVSSATVGFTQLDRFTCFSAAKNNLADAAVKLAQTGYAESMASCERDYYDYGVKILRLLGCSIENGARIILLPSFGITLAQISKRLPEPEKIKITARSSLILDGNVEIHELFLDGHLKLAVESGSKILIKSLHEVNAGTELVPLSSGEKVGEEISIRGYKLVVQSNQEISCSDKAFTVNLPQLKKGPNGSL